MIKGRQVYNKIKSLGGDACVFYDEVSSYWITGFYSTDGAVIVDNDSTKLYVDSRYIEAATMEKKSGKLFDDVEVCLLDSSFENVLSEYVKNKKIVIDSEKLSVAQYEKLQKKNPTSDFIPCANICGEFRMIKSPDEIEKIKTAQEITDATFSYMLTVIREGMTERELAAELEFFARKNGADGMAFDTILVSGSNSSLPHGVPTNRPIVKNSFLTMDFGAKYQGYCSDMTRTVVLGKADDEMKNIYNTVLNAQNAAISAIKSGIIGSECDGIARKIITDAGYGKNFGHSLGHSLGIEIHESPRFAMSYNKPIYENTVMTVEPGIYLDGKYGVRIEDMVLLTADGCVDFTKSDKKLLEV